MLESCDAEEEPQFVVLNVGGDWEGGQCGCAARFGQGGEDGAPHRGDHRLGEGALEADVVQSLGGTAVEQHVAKVAYAFGAHAFCARVPYVEGVAADQELGV